MNTCMYRYVCVYRKTDAIVLKHEYAYLCTYTQQNDVMTHKHVYVYIYTYTQENDVIGHMFDSHGGLVQVTCDM